MKTKKVLFIISGIIIFLYLNYYLFNNYFTKKMIVGSYVNKNYQIEPWIEYIPYQADTLVLFHDGKFSSTFWGQGNYKISYSIRGTAIQLINKNPSNMGLNTNITRMGVGKPKIILFKDLNQYYEKID
jgi:hypothetical protein